MDKSEHRVERLARLLRERVEARIKEYRDALMVGDRLVFTQAVPDDVLARLDTNPAALQLVQAYYQRVWGAKGTVRLEDDIKRAKIAQGSPWDAVRKEIQNAGA